MITQLLKFKLCMFPISISIFFQPDSKQNANTQALAIISSSSWQWCDRFQQTPGPRTLPGSLNRIICIIRESGGQLSLICARKGWEENGWMLVATFCGDCSGCQPPGCDRFVGSRHETKSKPARAYIRVCEGSQQLFSILITTTTWKHTYQSCKFCLPRVLV